MSDFATPVTLWTLQWDEVSQPAFQAWLAVLSDAEKERAQRFVHGAQRHAYVAAHALLRRLLETTFGEPAAQWRFVADGINKPQLAGDQDPKELQFSLAHTHQMVCCAVSLGVPLGVDVEWRGRRLPQQATLQTILSAAERAVMDDGLAQDRPDRFLRLWTLREAFVKATGRGLHFPGESFSFALDPVRLQSDAATRENRNWQFQSWMLPHHVLALAAGHSSIALRERGFTQTDWL